MENLTKWETVLTLKEEHPQLGFEGRRYFISEFAFPVHEEGLLYLVTNPTYAGLGLSSGIFTYALTKEQLNELFTKEPITLRELEKEMEQDFWDARREDSHG